MTTSEIVHDLLYSKELPEINALTFLQENEVDIENSFRQEWCHKINQDPQVGVSIGGVSAPEVASVSLVPPSGPAGSSQGVQVSAMAADPAMVASEVKPPDPPPSDFFTAIEAAKMVGVDWDMRPHIYDQNTKSHLLLDSGAAVTAYPPDP